MTQSKYDCILGDYLEEGEYWLDHYTGENCIVGGRLRVEVTNRGRRMCEKCHSDQTSEEI